MIKTFNLQQGEFLLKNPLLLHFYYLKQANPNAVLYTDGKGNVGYFNKENHVSVYCNDEEFIAQFYDVLPKGELHFSATSPFVRNWIAKRHQFVWTCDCNFYYYNGKPLPQPQHEVGSLTVDYVDLVATGTSYTADKEEIKQAIANRETSAIYVDGKPVCWCVTHDDYSMGMLYTLPEHRHKGYALSVMLDICHKLLKKGIQPFCYIIFGNTASENLAKKYNMEKNEESFYFGIEKI